MARLLQWLIKDNETGKFSTIKMAKNDERVSQGDRERGFRIIGCVTPGDHGMSIKKPRKAKTSVEDR